MSFRRIFNGVEALELSLEELSNAQVLQPSAGEVLGFDGQSWANVEIPKELAGKSYIYVSGNGSAAENGLELQDAYSYAKSLTPYGLAISSSNRVRIIVAPGTYATSLTLDTPFIDIVSLDGEKSITLSGIDVDTDNVYVRGISVGSSIFAGCKNKSNIVIEKCSGGDFSFVDSRSGGQASGTFIDCVGGAASFGGGASSGGSTGTFIRCTGGLLSFGYNTNIGATGLFVDCVATANATFSGISGGASGTFINCSAQDDAFGRQAKGTFINCVATGNKSFGTNDGGVSSTARILYCRKLSGSFSTPASGGKIRYSLDGSFNQVNLG